MKKLINKQNINNNNKTSKMKNRQYVCERVLKGAKEGGRERVMYVVCGI